MINDKMGASSSIKVTKKHNILQELIVKHVSGFKKTISITSYCIYSLHVNTSDGDVCVDNFSWSFIILNVLLQSCKKNITTLLLKTINFYFKRKLFLRMTYARYSGSYILHQEFSYITCYKAM